MRILLSWSMIFLVFLTGCREFSSRKTRGSGHITTETRHTGSFENVDVSGAISVYVRQEPESSVKVEADDNLHEFVEVHVSGNTLDVHTRRGYRMSPSRQIRVYISNPSYRRFEISGASNLYSENRVESSGDLSVDLTGASKADLDLKAPRVTADLTGASHLKLKGETRVFSVDGSGASKLYCFDLLSEETSLDLTGASHAEVHASVKLDVGATGAASVRYKGSPEVSQRISGAGSVKKAE